MAALRSRSGRPAPPPLDERQLYDYAVGQLARQMRTVAQLKRLMRGRVEPGPEGEAHIDAALERLRDHGYLSDPRFALSYATARKDNQRLGRRRVAQELLQKGVPAQVVHTEVAAAYQDIDEDAQARAFLVRKRVPPLTGDRDEDRRTLARVFRMLLRAGFAAATASRALRGLRASPEDLSALEEGGTDDPG